MKLNVYLLAENVLQSDRSAGGITKTIVVTPADTSRIVELHNYFITVCSGVGLTLFVVLGFLKVVFFGRLLLVGLEG